MGSPGGEPPYGEPPYEEPPYGVPPPPYRGSPQPPPYGPYGQPRPPSAQEAGGYQGPPYGPRTRPAAGRWRRLFAGVVDLFLVGLLTSPFSSTAAQRISDTGVQFVQVGNGFVVAVIWFLYFWALTAFWHGQTVGKKIFRLRVVDPAQEPVTPAQAAVREVVYGIFSVVCFLGLVDLAWILFDGKKQALHDKAASTVVVDA